MTSVPAPRISVVVPTYNRARYLSTAVDAVLDQSLSDFEIIVVDDGSTDDTAAVLASLTDPRVRSTTRLNGGICAARNTGAALARAEAVVFLDDDDRPDHTWLARLVESIDEPDVAVVSFGARLVNESGELIRVVLPGPLGPAFDGAAANTGPHTYCVRTDVFMAVGGYTEGLEASHQTEFALRLLPYCVERGLGVVALREPLITMERRSAADRREMAAAKLLQGSTYLIEHHGERLARDPHRFADYLGVAGVAAARVGDYRRARGFLARAARLEPTRPKRLARLGLALVPPMGRRVWGTASDQLAPA